jgi:hypothetical protein
MARKTAAHPALSLPTVARKRKSYEERCGMAGRAAQILAKAQTEKPVYIEDADGHMIRDWSQPHERLSNDDLRIALVRMHAVEREDLLQYVSPAVIRYAEQHKWIVRDATGGFYRPTTIAEKHLSLPVKDRDGRKIRFLAA